MNERRPSPDAYFLSAHAADSPAWLVQTRAKYTLHYAAADGAQVTEYESFFAKGIDANEAFFRSTYPKRFDVYIHPDRTSFDTALQTVFHQPSFHSECWMTGVGGTGAIHVLAPARWGDLASCEGRYTTYADKEKTQKFITHELTHVFHGQARRKHNLDMANDISWFAEGLATYVSGQLTPSDIHDVQNAVQARTVPGSLNGIATFDSILLRYNMMGSLAMYIDRISGRAKLESLMQFDSQKEILSNLGVTEQQFLDGWKLFMLQSAGMAR